MSTSNVPSEHASRRQTSDALSQTAVIRCATPSDVPGIEQAIGRAFFDDPVAEYLFPSATRRAAGFGRFAGLAMIQFGDSGRVDVAETPKDAIRGAAIWQAPDPKPNGVLKQFILGLRFWSIIRGNASRASQLMAAMEEHHPKESHWYLATLGVEPAAQGLGLGAALMQPVLERCDKEGRLAYLESSKESNIPFYQRHGFEVSGEIELDGGPRLWPMRREIR